VRVIALDTSTPITSCALLEDETVVWERLLREKAGDVLPAALGDLQGIEAVAVGLGPGSFTGLRVGLAAAKTLSYARRLPIAGISSLQALAAAEPGLVCAATEARRNELFIQFFLDGAPRGEVRVVLAAALELGEARLLRGTPSAAVIARLCLPALRERPYDRAACFALAPDYRQGFANLT
jgi:tRNA threonylcarbamoyl adenosine modification protein YeaZ